MKKQLIFVSVTLCCFVSIGQTTSAAEETAMRPNIVVIYADDLGYGDLGCYGATKVSTPNIDGLARQGRLFTDAHTASAVCTPSRYCLLTGRYAWRENRFVPIFHRDGLIIDTDRTTIASMLKTSGYNTACIGKWHLGFCEGAPDWNGELKPGPLELGFDYYFGVPIVNSHPPFVYVENHHVVGLDPADPLRYNKNAKGPVYAKPYPEKMGIATFRGGRAAHELYKDEEVCTELTGRAVDWIEKQNKEKPFFLYFATTNIHHPFTPNKQFQGTSEAGRYGDFIHELDWAVGQVLSALKKTGAADNTIVLFTSDNGGMLNEGGHDAWRAGHRLNGDLLGFKFDIYEGGHRIPYIVRWPGRIEPDTRSDQLICSVDLLATLAEIVGYKQVDDEGPDGVSVLSAWTDQPEQPIRDHVILASRMPSHVAIRSGRWIYIPARGPGGFGGGKNDAMKNIAFAGQKNSDMTPDGKIRPGAPMAQLYDLEADPSQTKNVIRENPEVAARLAEILKNYRNP